MGTPCVADRFWQFCKSINIEQVISSAWHHQSNRQVKACIKFIKCMFKKCADSGRDINMALLQIHMMQLGQGLPSLATLMFSRQVHSIMPVIDCKPLVKDCDDDHHNKLIERQQKNTNDASSIFPRIHIGSAVAVQQEESGPWTHGTIVGTGNHNHHNTSYMIQLTTNGRGITHNRCHIKPTTVTVKVYIQYHSTKQQNTRADPLADILNNTTKNPVAYATIQTTNILGQSDKRQKEEAKDKEQHSSKARNSSRQTCTDVIRDNRTIIHDGDTIKTRSGHVSK